MADAVGALLADPAARAATGAVAAARVRARHVPEVAAPLLHASLRRWERRR
jgi:hypothetical protein